MKEPETKQEIEEAIADYRNLLNSSGWKRVVAQLDANIKEISRQLEEGIGEETLDEVKLLREKLRLMREMRNTPETVIARLESPESAPVNPDPFDTVKDVEERKKEEAVDTEEE